MDIGGIVIAGGKSTRMGEDKALMEYEGKRLIDNAISIIEPLCSAIIVSSNKIIDGIEYLQVKDTFSDIGPIGGLHATLSKSIADNNIIIPCDVPDITSDFYLKMLSEIHDADAVIPRHANNEIEPLIGVYSKRCLLEIENQIAKGDFKMVNLLHRLSVYYFDVKGEANFRNINSPSDF